MRDTKCTLRKINVDKKVCLWNDYIDEMSEDEVYLSTKGLQTKSKKYVVGQVASTMWVSTK